MENVVGQLIVVGPYFIGLAGYRSVPFYCFRSVDANQLLLAGVSVAGLPPLSEVQCPGPAGCVRH